MLIVLLLPTLVECKTYRPLAGEDDVTWPARDPLQLMRRHLVDRAAWTDTADAELLGELRSTVDRATMAAAAADEPDPKSATERVWAKPIEPSAPTILSAAKFMSPPPRSPGWTCWTAFWPL